MLQGRLFVLISMSAPNILACRQLTIGMIETLMQLMSLIALFLRVLYQKMRYVSVSCMFIFIIDHFVGICVITCHFSIITFFSIQKLILFRIESWCLQPLLYTANTRLSLRTDMLVFWTNALLVCTKSVHQWQIKQTTNLAILSSFEWFIIFVQNMKST